jgi:hypothetical protein
MRSFLPVVVLIGAQVTAADTLSSCGATGDHLTVTNINVDADATGGPRKGKPFTITLEGNMDEAHQHGTVVGNLHVKALGFVNEDVTFNQKYDFYPGVAAGPTKLAIGPFTFPRSIPGEVDVTGTITMVNGKAEPVLCLNLALKIPTIIPTWSEALGEALGLARDNCGDPSKDHIKNVVSNTVDGVITSTMDLDEDLDFIDLSTLLAIKPPLLPAVNLNLPSVPISLTPGISKGQLKFVGYPPANSSSVPNDLVTVDGDLKLSDKNGDEVACAKFGSNATLVV